MVAQRLKRADEGTAEDARRLFLEYWERDGQRHFRQEEELLLPTFAAFEDPDHPLVARVLVDHVRIRQLAMRLGEAEASPSSLHDLGFQLDQHIRREERELFPLIERSVPEPELIRLGEELG